MVSHYIRIYIRDIDPEQVVRPRGKKYRLMLRSEAARTALA
jgi:hypothetical protein